MHFRFIIHIYCVLLHNNNNIVDNQQQLFIFSVWFFFVPEEEMRPRMSIGCWANSTTQRIMNCKEYLLILQDNNNKLIELNSVWNAFLILHQNFKLDFIRLIKEFDLLPFFFGGGVVGILSGSEHVSDAKSPVLPDLRSFKDSVSPSLRTSPW